MKKTLIGALLAASATAAKAATVLVVLSDASQLELKDGKTLKTGFFLNELMQPVQILLEQGHTVVYATPDGRPPALDRKSDDRAFFGGDEQARKASLAQLNSLGLTAPQGSPVISLDSVKKNGYDHYAAVYVPGGHAPMQDLLKDARLGQLLAHFHAKGKPTALTCHGTIALLSALPGAAGYVSALEAGRQAPPPAPWIYQGYRMTVISNAEEGQSADFLEGGEMKMLPQDALAAAGGVLVTGAPWSANVVEDRELVSGQNPQSALALGYALAKKLK